MNQYYLTILILVAAVALMMFFGRQRRTDLKKPLELTPKVKKRIVEASVNVGVDDTARHYELSPRTVRRLRVFAGVEPKTCASCENFNVKKGQEAIASNQNMLKVTQAISPAVYTGDVTNDQSWSEFGACSARAGSIIGPNDWCGKPSHVEQWGGDKWA